MPPPWTSDPRTWPLFGRSARIPGPLGCLLALVLLPLLLVALVIFAIVQTLGLGRARRDRVRRGPPEDEPAVASLVEKMALDESFRREEVVQAGEVAPSGATAEDLLDRAVDRGWIAERDGVYSVTERGRREAGDVLRRLGL